MKMWDPLFKNYKEFQEGGSRALAQVRALLHTGPEPLHSHMPTKPALHHPLEHHQGVVGWEDQEGAHPVGAAGVSTVLFQPPLQQRACRSLPTLAHQGPFPHHD